MHRFLRNLIAWFFPPIRSIDELLASNEPLTDEERAKLLSKLKDLEAELDWLLGPPYDVEDPEGEIQQTQQSIRNHLFVLSSVRDIPMEVWQQIFEFAVLDPTVQGRDPLRLLTQVSRGWYAATTTHRILWSILPAVSYLNVASPITPTRHSAIRSRLQLFFSRSGSNKIDFQLLYSSSEDVWKENRAFIVDILDTFVKVSCRWRKAVLNVPAEIVEQGFSPLRSHGRLPCLEELQLVLSVWGLGRHELLTPGRLVRVDHFNDAPNLRHVTLNTSVLSVPELPARTSNTTIFDFQFPWSQIETYQSTITTIGNDESYCRLIQNGSHERLREVVHAPGLGPCPFPTISTPTIIFPSLVKLCLRLGPWQLGDHLIMHLRKLLLPSLMELEAYGATFVQRPDDNPQPTLYDAITTLIRNSGCSNTLLRLRLDEKVGPRSVDQLRGLFSLCPALEYLDVRVLQDPELWTLCLGTRLPKTLPHLRVLTLRWPPEWTYRESQSTEIRGKIPPMVKPSTLWSVVESRISTQRPRLEEVRLLGSSSTQEEYGVLTTQMNLLVGGKAWPFPGGSWEGNPFDYEEMSQLRTTLQRKFKPIGGRYSIISGINPLLHWGMHGIMCKLEGLDIGGFKGVILARLGVLYHLEEIAHTEEGVIPGDWMYSLRSRAANLLAKWKPIILPQFQASSQRWCYVPLGSTRLQCQPGLPSRKTEDEVWRDAVGYAIE